MVNVSYTESPAARPVTLSLRQFSSSQICRPADVFTIVHVRLNARPVALPIQFFAVRSVVADVLIIVHVRLNDKVQGPAPW